MARLTPEQWEVVRAEFETTNASLAQLSERHGVHKSNISKRAKAEQWEKGKTQHLVEKKVNAIKELHETQQQTQHLNATTQQAIDCEVQKRLEAEAIFIDAAKYNQTLANQVLGNIDVEELRLTDLDTHARLTARNKETVLGKSPETAIQINNKAQGEPVINLTLNGGD